MQGRAPFGPEVVRRALREGWAVDPEPEAIEYAQVGYGSWHWHLGTSPVGRVFVTADKIRMGPASHDDAPVPLDELTWAYSVARRLADTGVPFVRPPVPTLSGEVLHVVEDSWAISLWPFLDGRSSVEGQYEDAAAASSVAKIVRVLHETPVNLDLSVEPRVETFSVPGLRRLLSLVADRWTEPLVGPLAADAEAVLHDHSEDIRQLADRQAELVTCAPPEQEWVMTHGEPHAANVVFTPEGPVLIDWDTAKIAPRERDLWMIASDGFDVGPVDTEMLHLYRCHWDLSELADYARRFSDPLDDGPEGSPAWEDFMSYIERARHRW